MGHVTIRTARLNKKMFFATHRQILFRTNIAVIFFLSSTFAVAGEGRESLGCSIADSGSIPPYPFDVGDDNNYGKRKLELTVPERCRCDGEDCTPCPIVVGYHGYGQNGSSWKSRLVSKGEAVGFISVYPTGDSTETNYFNWGALKKRRSRLRQNWAVPSCQDVNDG